MEREVRSWRKAVIDTRKELGDGGNPRSTPATNASNDEVNALIPGNLSGLNEQFVSAVTGSELREAEPRSIQTLVISGGDHQDPVAERLYTELEAAGENVAYLNVTDLYQDKHQLLVTPNSVPPIERAILCASTQDPGGLESLQLTIIGLLSNPNISGKINRLYIVNPMYANSRSVGHDDINPEAGEQHRLAAYSAELLSGALEIAFRKAAHRARELGIECIAPEVTFMSVDIHDQEIPKDTFEKELGYDFINVDPSPEMAAAIHETLVNSGYAHLPKKVISCDASSFRRAGGVASNLVEIYKANGDPEPDIEVIETNKSREKYEQVGMVEIVGRYTPELEPVNHLEGIDPNAPCVLVYVDDMKSSGETSLKNMAEGRSVFKGYKIVILGVTHAPLPLGVGVLDGREIDKVFYPKADYYDIGDTLNRPELESREDVTIFSTAPSIIRAIKEYEQTKSLLASAKVCKINF